MDGRHEAKREMMFLRVKFEGGNDYQINFVGGVNGTYHQTVLLNLKLGTGGSYVVGNILKIPVKINNALNFCVFAPVVCL